VFHDGGSHDADGAGAGDQNVFAEHVEGEGGVNGIAEWVEDGGDFTIDVRLVMPDIRHGDRDKFGECAGAIDADSPGVSAKMAASGETVAAASAHDVAFGTDDVAGVEVLHVRADLDDFTDELMADSHGDGNGLLRPGVPLVDVQVGAADAGLVDANEDVVDGDGRDGHVLQPQARFLLRLHECFHGLHALASRPKVLQYAGRLFDILNQIIRYARAISDIPEREDMNETGHGGGATMEAKHQARTSKLQRNTKIQTPNTNKPTTFKQDGNW
jgi:hypothetical protein